MKTRTWCLPLLVATALVALPAVAGAQPQLRSFGFGAGLSLASSLSGQISVPVNVGPTLRVEPIIGLNRKSVSTETKVGEDTATTDKVEQNIQLGVGAYYLMRTNDPFLLYVGPRLGVVLDSDTTEAKMGSNTTTTTESGTDIALAIAFGGEYFFNPRLSLGAEVALNYFIIGERTTEVDPKPEGANGDDDTERSESVMATSTNVWVRFYY